jgi:hypothetical protein
VAPRQDARGGRGDELGDDGVVAIREAQVLAGAEKLGVGGRDGPVVADAFGEKAAVVFDAR